MTDKELYTRACKFIPGGTNTYSKEPCRFVEGLYPIYLERGKDAYVWGRNGRRYIDYICSLGTNLLGHAHPKVTEAIIKQARKGILFSLPHPKVVELAEKICSLIPCAEQVRFLKTGSEATSAAVKIARAYTGRSEIIVFKGHYHGWHSWFSGSQPKNAGTLQAERPYTNLFPEAAADYRKLTSMLESLTPNIAAIILEPCTFAELPLETLRRFCNYWGAVLIFDEVITGFRFPGFSAQKYFGVTPDLACFGKAAANGLPLSFVCGKRDLMQVIEKDCFISSTFAEELLSISAALATIEVLERENSINAIWQYGKQIQKTFNEMSRSEMTCDGFPCRLRLKFPSDQHKALFWQECVKQGILLYPSIFISAAHGSAELDSTLAGFISAYNVLLRYWDNPSEALEGSIPESVIRQ